MPKRGELLYTHPPPCYGLPVLDGLPSLVAICIRLLISSPDQVHLLPVRLSLRHSSLIRELVPDPALVDPRLWATLVQVYDGLPAYLASHTLPLSDIHLPTIQAIPSTSRFSLLTILSLPACSQLTDDTILHLNFLHTLTAFDASNTSISSYALSSLSATLQFDREAHRGPWQLRVLAVRNCRQISNDVFPSLLKFPLLSVIDLRGTGCRPNSSLPFKPSEIEDLYHPASLETAVSRLYDMQSNLFSSNEPHVLNINALYRRATNHQTINPVAPQDAFVVMSSNNPKIKVGNTHVLAKEIQARENAIAHEQNKAAWYKRQESIESRRDEAFRGDKISYCHPTNVSLHLHTPILVPSESNISKPGSHVTTLPLPSIPRKRSVVHLSDQWRLGISNSITNPSSLGPRASLNEVSSIRRPRIFVPTGSQPHGTEVSDNARPRAQSSINGVNSLLARTERVQGVLPMSSNVTVDEGHESQRTYNISQSSNSRSPQAAASAPPIGATNSRPGASMLRQTSLSSSTVEGSTSTSAASVNSFYQPLLPSRVSPASTSLRVQKSLQQATVSSSSKASPTFTSNFAERAAISIPTSDASLRLFRHPVPWSALQDTLKRQREERETREHQRAARKSEVAMLNTDKMNKMKRQMEGFIQETTAKRKKVDSGVTDRNCNRKQIQGRKSTPMPLPSFDGPTKLKTKNPFRSKTIADPELPGPDPSFFLEKEKKKREMTVTADTGSDSDDETEGSIIPDNGGLSDDPIENVNYGDIFTVPTSSKVSCIKVPLDASIAQPESSNAFGKSSQVAKEKRLSKLTPVSETLTPAIEQALRQNHALREKERKDEERKAKAKINVTEENRRKSTGSSANSKPFDWKSWGKSK